MERLTKPCEDTKDGKYATHVVGNCIGIYKNHEFGKTVERLAYYEDLEEQGRLIILSIKDIYPCKHCDSGWGSISMEGCQSCHDTCIKLKQYYERYRY